MSLNRSEQVLLEYVQAHREERQFWEEKVQNLAATGQDQHEIALKLDTELWRYYQERSDFVPKLVEALGPEKVKRVSLRNLAEYWLRVWTKPRRKNPPPPRSKSELGDL